MMEIHAWLLHHANRYTKRPEFYAIKNRLLKSWGKHIGYDVQFIEGKKCHSCDGEGSHPKYGYNGEIYDYADCYHCHNGWYRLPTWNILERLQFGKYIFHQPFKRVYNKPEIEQPIIDGYIEHTETKYGKFAATVLYLVYEKGYLKRWYREAGIGWRVYWWYPRNWIPNAIHIIKRGYKAVPFMTTRSKIKYLFREKPKPVNFDDLPF